MSTSENEYLKIDSSLLDLGYKNASASSKQLFGDFLWMVCNLSGADRRGIDALTAHLARVSNFLDLFSKTGLPPENWTQYRNEVNQALQGRCRTSELAALYDTVKRFEIPAQFIFDPLNGADHWMRTEQFDSQDEYDTFTSLVGGSSLASVFPILDVHVEPKQWQAAAIKGGQAIYQTILLANFYVDLNQDQIFLPKQAVQDADVDLEKVKAGECDKNFRHLCRVQVTKIEPHLRNAGKLVHKFELDGQRAMTSLLAWSWRLLMKIKTEPECITQEGGPLSSREFFILKLKHWMGLEGNVPIIPDHGHH